MSAVAPTADRAPGPAAEWLTDPEAVRPTVLVLGGLLTMPPLYGRLAGRLVARDAAAVVVAPIWTPDWLLATQRGLGPVLTRAGRALLRASEAAARPVAEGGSGGAPILVIGHSAGGIVARLLTSPDPFERRRLGAHGRIGAIVTLGTPHAVSDDARLGQRLAAAAASFADRVVPGGFFAPRIGYLAVASRGLVGRPDGGRRSRAAYWTYQAILSEPGAESIDGDGLVPVRSATLAGAPGLVLDGFVHGQLAGRPWYGSPEAIDIWWPEALATWRAALRTRAAETSRG